MKEPVAEIIMERLIVPDLLHNVVTFLGSVRDLASLAESTVWCYHFLKDKRHDRLWVERMPIARDLLRRCVKLPFTSLQRMQHLRQQWPVHALRELLYGPLVMACFFRKIEVVGWLLENFDGPTAAESANSAMLRVRLTEMTCVSGCLGIAEKLVRALNITKKELSNTRKGFGGLLSSIVIEGDIAVLEWFVYELNVTLEDVRACKESLLGLSCERGHLMMAIWLTSVFALEHEDARAKENYALKKAYLGGHSQVIVWLERRFEFVPEEISEACAWAFEHAKKFADLEEKTRPRDSTGSFVALSPQSPHADAHNFHMMAEDAHGAEG
jgi:hypothetical protein